MKHLLRFVAIFVFALTALTVVRPAQAACQVGAGSIGAGGGSTSFSVPAGHTYLFGYSGVSSGSIPFTGPVSVTVSFGSGPYSWAILDLTINCATSATFFSPGDGRLDPRPADRLAVYCNSTTLDVWGVGNDSRGHRLIIFSLAKVIAAGSTGLQQNLGGDGIVAVGYYGRNLFGVSWIGGPLNGNGQADFRKTVTCSFSPTLISNVTNTTSSTTPGVCSPSVVVQPGDTLFHIATTHGTTVPVLVQLNKLVDPNRILIGQVICLPG